ncbi:MAG: GNAT family N-acetyltransferase [Rubripirellula sp.]
MTTFQTNIVPLKQLEIVLPGLLSNLPIARAQIAIDQLRGAIETDSGKRVLLLFTCEEGNQTPVAAAVAIQQPSHSETPSDMATVIHAGGLAPSSLPAAAIASLRSALASEFSRRGVRFVQWATELVGTEAGLPIANWCQGLGFQPLGNLDYMTAADDESSQVVSDAQLRFRGIDPSDRDALQSFAELIEQTYTQTQDCPGLNEFRSAAETLEGYQNSNAFAPEWWFVVSDSKNHSLGALILGFHQPASTQSDAQGIVEIVYMGVAPQARGRSLGRQLVAHAFRLAKQGNASRVILAVDQQNSRARSIYKEFGFQTMLTESVWARSIDDGGDSPRLR